MIAFPLPPLSLEILDGDIADQATDAIVNAANTELWMGAGVAGAIKARGGQEIEDEAMAQGPVAPGECVMTSSGRLPARYVIHAAVMGQDLRTSAELIERATRNTLTTADGHQLESIALPALGTGVGGFPLDQCARIMIGVVRAHATPRTSVRVIRLVLFGRAAFDTFATVARETLNANPHEQRP